MPDYKKVKLIAIYMYISELYESELKYTCQRFSNNSSPEFTDAELMTVYLFLLSEQEYVKLKQIHRFAEEYLWLSYHHTKGLSTDLTECLKLLRHCQ